MTPGGRGASSAGRTAAVIDYRANGASPFLLVCDHAGRRIPRSLHNLGLAPADLARHIAWDIGIAGVGRALADRLDACLIMQPYSRLVIDCNRPPGSADVDRADKRRNADPRQRKSVGARTPRCACAKYSRPIIARSPTQLDAQSQGAAADDPDFAAQLHAGVTPASRGRGRPACSTTAMARWPQALLALLRAPGDLVVGDNEPYDVTDDTDYTIPVHGEQRGIPHVAIEIRQDLIGEEAGQRQWAERLADLLPKAAAKI